MKDEGRIIAAIGNSTCRLAVVRGSVVDHSETFTHAAWRDGRGVRAWLEQHATRATAGMCSVVPALTEAASAHFAEMGQSHVELRIAAAHAMQVDYDPPVALGIDRYCAAVGARLLCGAPVIAIDFGTAITVNVVDRRGVFIGGAILPGYAACLQALHATTALLPDLAVDESHAGAAFLLARTTEEAMRIGVGQVLSRGLRAYVEALTAAPGVALVDEHGAASTRIMNNGPDTPLYGGAVSVVCTGGGVAHFSRVVVEGWRSEPGLVLVGAAEELRVREAPNPL